jgi:hypothetical protein
LEAIPGKYSIDSLQKTAILGTWNIIRKTCIDHQLNAQFYLFYNNIYYLMILNMFRASLCSFTSIWAHVHTNLPSQQRTHSRTTSERTQFHVWTPLAHTPHTSYQSDSNQYSRPPVSPLLNGALYGSIQR